MRDNKLVYLDKADISGSVTSNVIEVAAATDAALTGSLHRYADNVRGAAYLNIHVHEDITGAEVVTLEDSADNSTFASSGLTVSLDGKKAGDVVSVAIPASLRNYSRVTRETGTAGVYSAFLGQREMETL